MFLFKMVYIPEIEVLCEYSKYFVKVIDVIWKINKNGFLKPFIEIESIKLNGALIEKISGFNAKFIVDYNIGQNAIIYITRSENIIPHIISVIKGTEPKMPDVSYKWDEKKIDIIDSANQNYLNLNNKF